MKGIAVSEERGLMVLKNQLVPTDHFPDLYDTIEDRELRTVIKEIQTNVAAIQAEQVAVSHSMAALSLICPDLAKKLRDAANLINEEVGAAPLRESQDPITGMQTEPDAQLEEKRLAEEAAKRAIEEETDLDKLTEKLGSAFAMKRQRALCDKVYRKIARVTHPDKTKDPDLNELLAVARHARDRLDLEMLKSIWASVESYLSLKKNRGSFKKFKRDTLLEKRRILEKVVSDRREFESSFTYRIHSAMKQGRLDEAKQEYRAFVEVAERNAEAELRRIRAVKAANAMRSRAFVFTSSNSTTTTL